MAWNPSPEVKVVRDAAAALSRLAGGGVETVDRAILLYTTRSEKGGYISYGETKELCGQARRLADIAWDAVVSQFEKAVASHYTHGAQAGDPLKVKWDELERDAVRRVRAMRLAVTQAGMPDDLRMAMMRDLILPAVDLLARFCACVQFCDEAAEAATESPEASP